MYAFLLSTAVIFVAELGDKSQLMAMTFAARYRARDVLIGITVATAVVHLASVGIGYWIGDAFADHQGAISVVAGVAFLGFAAWTLRGDELTEDEAEKARRSTGAAIIAVGVAFFLAELGDKTMLATITLATQEGWLGTWIGSTVGMVAADALAIGVGALLGRRLPEDVIRYGAATLIAPRRRQAHASSDLPSQSPCSKPGSTAKTADPTAVVHSLSESSSSSERCSGTNWSDRSAW